MSLRILFVDDDPNLLGSLHQKLFSFRDEWKMTFARGEEAAKILREDPHDVVVSDRDLPPMDEVPSKSDESDKWPGMVRIVLSGQSDEESTLRSIGTVSEEQTEPCSTSLLRTRVQRAVALHHLLKNERVKVVVARMDTLPSAPALLQELMLELTKDQCSLVHIGEIVAQDVAMTAKILRLVNSAYFGLRFEVSNPEMAVRYLGINTVTSLVMACQIFKHADKTLTRWLDLNQMWHHSLTTSQWARKIAESETRDPKLADDAIAAGMLHDSGRLVLAVNFPDTYRQLLETAKEENLDLVDYERQVLGVTHAEVGAYLMGVWGLRDAVVEAIAYHHRPSECVNRKFAPLTAVHAACVLSKGPSAGDNAAEGGPLDRDYISEIGCLDRVEQWCDLDMRIEEEELIERE